MTKLTRRDWIKSSALLSGSFTLAALPFSDLQANEKSPTTRDTISSIKEIHLINLSHHDYGYTDLPSSIWDYQVNNIRLAIKYMEDTKDYPVASQFKWTLEGLWSLEKFWQDASESEKRLFEKYVASGHFEVTAMPGNMTCLVDRYEWEGELDRLKFLYDKFKPTVALQDDVNGLPWGMVESLLDRNVNTITMAANGYHGGYPIPPPSFFWWEGISKKKILMYNRDGYAVAYDYFHETEWRKGPVPNRYDIWFNPPSGNEIFSSRKEDMLKAKKILERKLESLNKQGYNLSAVLLTFTNEWTIDNDLPCRQLSEFVRSWNEAGMQPRLVFSTPSQFISKVKPELSNIPTLRGEWCDWWADGIAASPVEVALLQDAKRRNKDIGSAMKYFPSKTTNVDSRIENLNHDLTFASEHTWGAYDSVSHPYNARTGGNHAQKFDYFFKADEDARRIQADIIRQSNEYKPLSQTDYLQVLNPGEKIRSGWAEISAVALRKKVNAVKDLSTGRVIPFDVRVDSEWIPAGDARVVVAPSEIPNDVWPYLKGKYKFHLDNMKPGEKRKFQLLNVGDIPKKSITSSRYFDVIFDEKTGQIKNIIYRPLGKQLFDDKLGHLPGQLIVERPKGSYSRDHIAERKIDPKNIIHTNPSFVGCKKVDNYFALRYESMWQEAFAKRIEQRWDVFDSIPRIEITTTVWMHENLDPLAVYMAFPFDMQSPQMYYDSMGSMVEVGIDQIPKTCGEYNTVQNGVSFKGADISVALTTLDLPMGIFETIQRGVLKPVFKPKTAHFYSIVCQNYWITNFAVLRPAKIVTRHVIECDKPGTTLLPIEGNELWSYPSP